MKLYYIVQGILWMVLLTVIVLSQGCAAYTVASGTSWGATGKSLTDHGTSVVTGADCNSAFVFKDRNYYCEVPRTPDTTYNRNAYQEFYESRLRLDWLE